VRLVAVLASVENERFVEARHLLLSKTATGTRTDNFLVLGPAEKKMVTGNIDLDKLG
jgi:hypothetical protein